MNYSWIRKVEMLEQVMVEKEQLTTLIEAFWEVESGNGCNPGEAKAAWKLQKAAGYTTDWDDKREQLAKEDE